ncbi:hypothetical protein ACFL4M_02670 [Pseudomonadota bacterium]
MYQDKYWKELYQLKVHLNYLDLYMEDSEFKDKAINIFLALTSSSSIAGWVVWQEAAIVWAIIIASSQVVTAIKVFLPYKARLKSLGGVLHEIEDLMLYTEKKWFDVSEGKLTEEEIHELQFEIRTRKTKALKKHFGNNTVPEKSKLFNKAQESADIYFENFYSVGG